MDSFTASSKTLLRAFGREEGRGVRWWMKAWIYTIFDPKPPSVCKPVEKRGDGHPLKTLYIHCFYQAQKGVNRYAFGLSET